MTLLSPIADAFNPNSNANKDARGIGGDLLHNPLGAFDPNSKANKIADNALSKDTVHHERLSKVFALAGWPGGFRLMRGYVHRESGGDPKAMNPSGATGLLQVMTPLHCGKYGLPKDTGGCIEALKNPVTNLKVAHKLYASGGGNPWKFAAPGVPAPAAVAPTGWDPLISWSDKGTLSGDLSGTVSGAVDAATGGVGGFLGMLSSADTWGRIAKGAGGGVAIILGGAAIVFVVATKAGSSPIGRTVRKVTP